jgi:hypothetical protein
LRWHIEFVVHLGKRDHVPSHGADVVVEGERGGIRPVAAVGSRAAGWI